MPCSEKTSISIYQFLRPSLRYLSLILCGLALLWTVNTSFAASKKHHKHAVTTKAKAHTLKKHKISTHKKTKSSKIKHHHGTHKKHTKVSAKQKDVVSDLSIDYDGETLIANVKKEAPVKTFAVKQKTIAEETSANNHAIANNGMATAESDVKSNNLFQSIADTMNFSPSKLTTEPEKAELASQAMTLPAINPLPTPAYLTKPAQPIPDPVPETVAEARPEASTPAPTEGYTSFAASVEKHLVNFVHKTVATLRYSDYKLGGKKFDTSRGVYIVDCSSFVDHILQRVSPRAYLSLVSATGADSPATQHYYEFFSELSEGPDNFWNKVEAVEQLRAGDILVFRYKNSRGAETGGHVMVVMDKPTQDSDVFFVRVADSAPSRHSQDTRQRNEAGIGIGTLVLKVNPRTGKPSAYAWGLGGLWNKNVNFAMARPLDTSSYG